ncbi:hypothetical protein ACJZ2D_016823 [Fusarium nematophilum]
MSDEITRLKARIRYLESENRELRKGSFHLFLKLPFEIRGMIWALMLPARQVITIYRNAEGLIEISGHKVGLPILMSICQESRQYALSLFKPITPHHTQVYLNQKRDILYFDLESLSMKNFAIEPEVIAFPIERFEQGSRLKKVCKFLEQIYFKNVKTILLVYDDPERDRCYIGDLSPAPEDPPRQRRAVKKALESSGVFGGRLPENTLLRFPRLDVASRRDEESGMDDEHHHGPGPSRSLLTEHEQPQPLLEPRHPLSARRHTHAIDYLRSPRRMAHPLTFTDLPPEVRLLVWEATWPGPRLIGIDAVKLNDQSTDEIEDDARLQILCSMASWLEGGASKQLPDEDRHPIALSICAESRKHTMKHFCLFRHHEQITWSLYLNPTCDVLAAYDMWDLKEEDLTNLSRSYGRQLARMKNLVLYAQHWDVIDELDILCYLGGIEVIQLCLKDDPTPAEISKLLGDIKLRYQNDNRYCSRFQLVDRAYKVRGEVEVTEHN